MKGLFIPEITAEMFRNGCLENIEALMAEGEIYDIEYSPWIPVKWHEITDEERKREGYPEEWLIMLDCLMPNDEEEILVTIKSSRGGLHVEKDVCYVDDGYSLDSGYVWIDDVVAWMPLPAPFEPQESEVRDERKSNRRK